MISNFLCPNSAKAKLLLLGLKPQSNKIDNPALVVNNSLNLYSTASALNLFFVSDFHLTFSDHVFSVSRACFYANVCRVMTFCQTVCN